MLSGIYTGLLIVLFIGIVGWAYSTHRRADFTEAARLPLDDAIDEPRP